MSRKRRNFTAKFKSDLVLELLKGDKDLNALAAENSIQPNLLRNWKKEFLDKVSVVFDDFREENIREKLKTSAKKKQLMLKKLDSPPCR
ncbi:transposase [Pectinatus sottacetonis]|uniref:transposase n=1 Tax=Pectinatus sottacetonis TaxID=1002795 RepID=UPI0018C54890|nr:transposase [Pectinatus sottacetonis]